MSPPSGHASDLAAASRRSCWSPDSLVSIDTFLTPPGTATWFALPDLAVVSIHPPGPCRVQTAGTTVVFTPVAPPGLPA